MVHWPARVHSTGLLAAPVCSLFYTFRENLVSIDELIAIMRQIQNIPEDKLQRIAEALDDNKDGKIDIDDVIKVGVVGGAGLSLSQGFTFPPALLLSGGGADRQGGRGHLHLAGGRHHGDAAEGGEADGEGEGQREGGEGEGGQSGELTAPLRRLVCKKKKKKKKPNTPEQFGTERDWTGNGC